MYNGVLPMMLTVVVTTLIYLAVIEGNPLPLVRKVLLDKTFALYLAIMLAVIGIDTVELRLEPIFERLVDYDFTPVIYQLEGNITAKLQGLLHSQFLTQFFAFSYVFVFPILVWVSMTVYTWHDDRNMMKKLLGVFILNYAIALPFYIFVAVNEAWYAHSGVELLVKQVYPAFDVQYRALSGLNNCFPSLHTSLAVSIALTAIHSGHKRLAYVMSLSAAAVVFSTLYLGIHWLTDVTGGMAAAVAATNLAILWVDGLPQVFTRLRQSITLFIGK